MINFDEYTNENKRKHNPNWPYIPDHPYRILIIGGSGTGKTNALLNLIHNQPDIDKIYLYVKDPYEDKYQYLINKRECVGINHLNDPRAFIEYSNDMHKVYNYETNSYFSVEISWITRIIDSNVQTNRPLMSIILVLR